MKKFINIGIISALLLALHACQHGTCDEPEGYVYKFEDGKDYSNNVCVHPRLPLSYQIYVPCKLHDGYYWGGNVDFGPSGSIWDTTARDDYVYIWDVYYLSFTYDDVAKGRAPSDWQENWRNYVIAHTPFAEIYAGPWHCFGFKNPASKFRRGDSTMKKYDQTYRLDTTKVNKLIDKGKLGEEYFTKMDFIKTPDAAETRGMASRA